MNIYKLYVEGKDDKSIIAGLLTRNKLDSQEYNIQEKKSEGL
jgi:hypothetical protein